MEFITLASQKADKTITNVESGGYYTWSTSQFPLLSQKKLAAGLLVIQPRGFAQPHYADSSKIAYICQGECIAGLISPEDSKEKVIQIQKGDCLPVPLGVVSWWYNVGDSKVTIIFLGKSNEYTPGLYNYFFLTGSMGILNGFSTKIINKLFHMNKKNEAENLIKSQNNSPLIIKINEGIKMPEPCKIVKQTMVFNLDSADGSFTAVTSENLPLLGKIGLSANYVNLESGSLFGPIFTTDSSDQLSYVTKGSGHIHIVGLNGKTVLDAKVQEGQLFFVPKFFPFAVEADEEGIEFFSVITSSKQVTGELAGDKSVLEALSPSVLEASLNMAPEAVQSFKSKTVTPNTCYTFRMFK